MNRDFKGVWIPKEIWLCDGLSAVDKVIFAEINSLDNEEHCIASNEYFAEFCDVSVSTVKRTIAKLINLGYIEVVEFNGRHRTIKVVSQQTVQIEPPDSSKCSANNIDNNINYNKEDNTVLSNDNTTEKSEYESHLYSEEDFLGSAKKKKKKRGLSLWDKCVNEIDDYTDIPALKSALIDYLKFRMGIKDKPIYNVNQWKSMLRKLDSIVEETKVDYKDIVKNSLDKGWLNFYPVNDKSKKDVFSEYNSVNCEKGDEDIVGEF